MKSLGALLLVAILCGGCVGRVTPDDLSGTWKMSGSEMDEKLELRADGTFDHSIRSGGTRTASGDWELIGVDRAPRVLLKYHQDFDAKRSTASMNVVRQWNGQLGLATDSERRLVLER